MRREVVPMVSGVDAATNATGPRPAAARRRSARAYLHCPRSSLHGAKLSQIRGDPGAWDPASHLQRKVRLLSSTKTPRARRARRAARRPSRSRGSASPGSARPEARRWPGYRRGRSRPPRACSRARFHPRRAAFSIPAPVLSRTGTCTRRRRAPIYTRTAPPRRRAVADRPSRRPVAVAHGALPRL